MTEAKTATATEKAATTKAKPARDLTPEGVDPRLDNRAGSQRPPLETFPAVPQQVDGPDIMHQAEHTAKALKGREADKTKRKGMFSPGPHGLSDESLREDDEPTFGIEGVKGE